MVRISEPQRFEGNRDAKELKNFLFDIEQNFQAASITSEEDKVSMASMYLSSDAKLWWRTKFDRAVCAIQTWDKLKKELKNSFFPENVEYNARKKLKELSHMGTMREYIGSGNRNGNGSGNGNDNGLTNPKAARGRHRVAECLKRSSLNALRATTGEPNEHDDPLDNTEEGLARVGSIHFLYALRLELDEAEFEKERGLMYVDIEIIGVASKALVDTGVTDTFITPEEVERCNLKLSKGKGKLKVVNSGAVVVSGNTKNVKTKVGPCEGNMDYTVVPMDDFDVVLGLDFMLANQVIPILAASYVMFQGDRPGVLAAWCLPRCRLFEVLELVQSTRTSTS
ncbi:hypothetical protein GQ457_02G028120 [Hibiscus cannabinus]